MIFSYRSYENIDPFASQLRLLNSPCKKGISIAIRGPSNVKILSIQYFNMLYHLATDLHRVYTLFPASDIVNDELASL